MYSDCLWKVRVLCGSAGFYSVGCTIEVAFLPYHSEAGFRPAIGDDFYSGSKGGGCSYEGGVIPVKEGGSEPGNVFYFFVDVVHEQGKEGIR